MHSKLKCTLGTCKVLTTFIRQREKTEACFIYAYFIHDYDVSYVIFARLFLGSDFWESTWKGNELYLYMRKAKITNNVFCVIALCIACITCK